MRVNPLASKSDTPFQGKMPGVEDGRFAHRLPEMLRLARHYLKRQYSAADIQHEQSARLVNCLIDAVTCVPAYRNIGIAIEDIQADPWLSLSRFPILNKKSVQSGLVDYVADDFIIDNCFRVVTSGSTGIPLTLLHDEDSHVHEAACFYRVLDDLPFEPGDKICRVFCDQLRPIWGVTAQFLPGQMELAALNLAQDKSVTSNYLDRLRSWSPVGLFGNPSDLLLLSMLLKESEIDLPTVQFVISAGENLLQNTRITLESIFHCKVRDVYSMQESRSIAWQCEYGTLHVNEDRVIMESINMTESGLHELIITPLMNRSMPLIRYRTGDLGRFVPWSDSPCLCGRQLGHIEDFNGRNRGFIVLSGNRLFGPKPIKQILTNQPVAAWQIVQRRPELLEILLVATPSIRTLDIATTIEKEVKILVNHEIDVQARWVQADELLGGPGKFQMMHLMSFALG